MRNPKSRYRARAKGMTLLEIMIVIAILGLLASVIVAAVMKNFERAKISACKLKINEIQKQVQQFSLSNDDYPQKLADLLNPPDGGPAFLKSKKDLKDPWRGEFVYRMPGRTKGNPFEIISKGPDGKMDTDDDISSNN